ncbi:hypothetical protein SS50377_24434 [Spironucleus salmonicida]|uniref:Nuclear pore protein n=2 Tax=Spironucleus TaxID=39709 RepID=V6LQN5_9EUKA|nr:hypothetical protein SS50377_24434 [Spironucleus salmonicida]|eukprot:EST46016.1 hypothetical protein SS50377_14004 [Spironucleus salmonicida]
MQSVLSILSKDISKFQQKQDEKLQLSLKFSNLNVSNQPIVPNPPLQKSTCELLNIHQNNSSLLDAYNGLFDDAKDLAAAEFGAEAFTRQIEIWDERKEQIEEFLGLQGSPQFQQQLTQLITAFYVASQRNDSQHFLINSCIEIFSDAGPLLEILKYLSYLMKDSTGTSISYLQKCLVQELKQNAKYSSLGSTLDVTTSMLNQSQQIVSDATQTGRTLRTSQTNIYETFGQDFSVYGQIYNCVKCGYSIEALNILEKNSQIDSDLAVCIENLVENDYETGTKLTKINEEIQDPYYHLLTQFFTPWAPNSVVVPAFLDSVLTFIISAKICGKQKIAQIYSNNNIKGYGTLTKAFILILQEDYVSLFNFLYQHSLNLELFVISVFLQSQLTESLYYPLNYSDAGNDLLTDIMKKQKTQLSVPLILTRFVDLIQQKAPILLSNKEVDLNKIFTLFNSKKLNSSVLTVQSYIQFLRKQHTQQPPLICFYLAKFNYLSKNFAISIECSYAAYITQSLASNLAISNLSQLFSSLLSYFFESIALKSFDISIFYNMEQIYQQSIQHFESHQQTELNFVYQFCVMKLSILTQKTTAACDIFNSVKYANLDLNFAKLHIADLVKFIHFFVKIDAINTKISSEKVREFVVFAHNGSRLAREDERLVGEIMAVVE